ncbi:MAG: hypothetical protein KGM43_16175 [Planctomycetota bacterium]|nr:hypothetical protein [Planctomycetota bacterium]
MDKVRIATIGSRILALAAAVLFCLGILSVWDASRLDADEGALEVESPIATFEPRPVGTDFPVTFTLINHSSRAIKVVGAESHCGRFGCLYPMGLPFDLPGHERREVTIDVHSMAPGLMDESILLFTDCPGKQRMELSVKGMFLQQPDKT